MSNASAAFELNTFPRIHNPMSASITTAKKYTMALLHFRSNACPSPGTNQPAAAATSASAGLIGFFCGWAILFKQEEGGCRSAWAP